VAVELVEPGQEGLPVLLQLRLDRISSSRSQMSRSATVCTRPAESPVLMLFQRRGEAL
jgi:hypothetical protein